LVQVLQAQAATGWAEDALAQTLALAKMPFDLMRGSGGGVKMLDRVMREIPKLTGAVVRADVHGESSYDMSEAGAPKRLDKSSSPVHTHRPAERGR
jgi:hypothetical protein